MTHAQLVEASLAIIESRLVADQLIPPPVRIDPNVVATIFNPGHSDNGRQITAAEFYRRPPVDETWWASRDVKDAHDRFRRCYLGNGKTPSLCRYMEHVEPHLHAPRRLRRIGHLPMMTMKELPE